MTVTLAIPVDHPAYAGHFPGFPILPGAVLLDEVLRELAQHRSLDLTQWQVGAVKFLERVGPGDPLEMEHTAPSAASIRFVVRCGATTVATGALARRVPDGEPHDL